MILFFSSWRVFSVVAAILIYALWGSPTPDDPGVIEAIIAALLLAAAGGWRLVRVFTQMPSSWEKAGQIFLFYGLSVPVIAALAAGNSPGAMIRDIIPFLFFLLPLFLMPAFLYEAGRARQAVTASIAAAGFIFSLRVAVPFLMHKNGAGWTPLAPADPFYLANAPTVLFAALLMMGIAGTFLYKPPSLKNIFFALALIAAALVPLMAMALVLQRASMGVIATALLFWLALAFVKNPARALLPLLVCAGFLWVGWDIAAVVAQDVARKTHDVGLNMRWQEARAVWESLGNAGFLAVLFGKGWGATVASPAVGGLEVNFTHSLLTTYWLKTGLCGLVLALYWLGRLALMLAGMLPRYPVLAVAIAGPVLIDVLLYASFKSLDFGLILLLIPLWNARLHNMAIDDKLPRNSRY